MNLPRYGVSVAILLLIAGGVPGTVASAQTAGLKIIIIAGEDAVNIIQQKTAVAPIVEVRDRNGLPVSGALVVFAIGGPGPSAFAGGVQTLRITTDAAGRAAASGLNPLASGAYQINVTATFRGQSATASIKQTNVATTAAEGAAGETGATAGAGASAVRGGGGGGLSATTIGIIAAAAAGGALAAVKASGGGTSTSPSAAPISTSTPTPTPTPTPAPVPTTYTGNFTGPWVITTTTASSDLTTTCVSTNALNGTLMMTLEPRADGTVTGTAMTTGTKTEVAVTVSPFCQSSLGTGTLNSFSPVMGAPGNLAFSSQSGSTGPTPSPGVGSVTCTESKVFSGTLAAGVVSGTLTFSRRCDGTNNVNGVTSVITGSGTTTLPVTLR